MDHELLIGKIHAYVFHIKSLKFIDNYLAGRKDSVKINLSFREWSEFHHEFPHGSGSVLHPLTGSLLIVILFGTLS